MKNNPNINDIAAEALNLVNPQPKQAETRSPQETMKALEWLTSVASFAGDKQALLALMWSLVCRYKDTAESGRYADEVMSQDDGDLLEEAGSLVYACESIASRNADPFKLFRDLNGLNGTVELVVGGGRQNGVMSIEIHLDPIDATPLRFTFDAAADKWVTA